MRNKVLVDVPSESQEPRETRRQASGWSVLYIMVLLALVGLSIYVVFRGVAFFNPGYNWLDRLFAVFLLCAEIFIFIHAIGYLLSTVKATSRYTITKGHVFAPEAESDVAVLIASYNEDPSILEETVISAMNMDYANKRVFIVDDSAQEDLRQGIQILAQRYGCDYVHRDNRRGYKAGAINDLLNTLPQKYMAVFDSDQKPVHDFLDWTVSLMEEDSKLAFVQTPQFYQNVQSNPVTIGASLQQAVFYEYICEGKSVSGAMFSCGSNIVYRIEALRSIGGFDERSITEDFATALRLHMKGWRSLYYNYVCVYGLAPQNLPGYFRQQMRWALGTLGVFKNVVAQFFKKPGALTLGQWWEYLLSGSYYMVGWANFFFIMCPAAFLLAGIKPLVADPIFYVAAFVPYLVFSMGTFYLSMGRRGYKAGALFTGQSLGFVSLWVLMNAAVMALFNIRRAFGVTPKGVGGKLAIRHVIPQLVLMLLSIAAVFAGVYKLTQVLDFAVLVNVVWAAYHAVLLGMVFYFNRYFEPYISRPVFIEESVP